MGLIQAPGAVPKLSYRVMQNFCALFDSRLEKHALFARPCYDNVYDPCASPETPRDFFTSLLVDTYTRNGWPLYLYYYPGDLQRSETLAALWGNSFQIRAEKEITEPVLVDMLNGAIYRFRRFEANGENLGIKYLPVTDYPLVLTDRKALTE